MFFPENAATSDCLSTFRVVPILVPCFPLNYSLNHVCSALVTSSKFFCRILRKEVESSDASSSSVPLSSPGRPSRSRRRCQ